MIRKTKLTKRLSVLLLCGALAVTETVPAMASSVIPETEQGVSANAAANEADAGEEASDEAVETSDETKAKEIVSSGVEETEKATPSSDAEKENATSDDEKSGEKISPDAETGENEVTESEETQEDIVPEEDLKTLDSNAVLTHAELSLATGGATSCTILEDGSYTARNIEYTLTYSDGTVMKSDPEYDAYWSEIDGLNDECYFLALYDENGKQYGSSDIPKGTYTLGLIDEEDNTVAKLSGFTLYVKPISAFVTEKLSVGKQTVKNTSDEENDYAKYSLYSFTPEVTGKYYMVSKEAYVSGFYYTINGSQVLIDLDNTLTELQKGTTYYFYFTGDKPSCEIELNQGVKGHIKRTSRPSTCIYTAYQKFPLSDMEVTFTYDEMPDATYKLSELLPARSEDIDYGLQDSYANAFRYSIREKGSDEELALDWLEPGTYTVAIGDFPEFEMTVTVPSDSKWKDLKLGDNALTNDACGIPGTYYRLQCGANTKYTISSKSNIASVYTLSADGTMEYLDDQTCSGKNPVDGMNQVYFNPEQNTTVYVLVENTAYSGKTSEDSFQLKVSKTQEYCKHEKMTENRTASTCIKAGSITYTCTDCGYIYTDKLPLDQNVHENIVTLPAVAATCTAPGKTEGTQCKDCGIILQEQKTDPATGHVFGNWTTTTPATAVADGVETRTCAKCGQKETRSIHKLTATGTLNATNFPLKVKQSAVLSVSHMAAGDKVVSWTSSNKKCATVDAKGKVTGKKKGTVTITATLQSGLKLTAKVKVQKNAVKTSKITVQTKKVKLSPKQSFQLSAITAPFTSKEKITYKTSNKKVATVSKKGKITAKKAGKATITVKSGKKSVKVTVTVTK